MMAAPRQASTALVISAPAGHGRLPVVGTVQHPDHGARGLMRLLSGLVHVLALTPLGSSADNRALPAVYLAASSEGAGVSGAYFKRRRPVRSKLITYDATVAARLWRRSERPTAQPASTS